MSCRLHACSGGGPVMVVVVVVRVVRKGTYSNYEYMDAASFPRTPRTVVPTPPMSVWWHADIMRPSTKLGGHLVTWLLGYLLGYYESTYDRMCADQTNQPQWLHIILPIYIHIICTVNTSRAHPEHPPNTSPVPTYLARQGTVE